jgi:hypothetical protein
MFSFIKKLQELLARLKKNKGLWFTTLTVTSVTGIVIFMYIILTMTSGVKQDVYASISTDYFKTLNNVLANKKQKYIELSQAILSNEDLLDAIEKNNTADIEKYTKAINTVYRKNALRSLIVSFFPVSDKKSTLRNTISSTLRSKAQISGIEVQQSGVFVTLIQPIISKGKFIGLIELKQSIHALKDEFEANNNNFVFLLDKKMLVKLSLKTKSGRYKSVIADYLVYQSAYSSRFYSKITDTGEEAFAKDMKVGHGADDVFFRTFKKTTDINGAEIGLYVIGESIEKNKGFVNIADSMIKSVTSVSLGLVISILLFMF